MSPPAVSEASGQMQHSFLALLSISLTCQPAMMHFAHPCGTLLRRFAKTATLKKVLSSSIDQGELNRALKTKINQGAGGRGGIRNRLASDQNDDDIVDKITLLSLPDISVPCR
jgi:hypothetical protein